MAANRAPPRSPRPARDRSLDWMLRVGDELYDADVIDGETRDELGALAREAYRGGR